MFNWNTANVLAAIDAGIREVIEAYNASYTFYLRNGFSIGEAYTFAMSSTIINLRYVERTIASEEGFAYNFIWALAEVNPGFIGIEA